MTVNDVVVTLCAGAVRDWLLERDALPEDPLVAMIPMSVRKRDERGTWGNRISMMIVPIPTNEPDPATRLRRTHELLRSAKERHSALPASLLTDATAFIPPAVASLAARNTIDILEPHAPAAEPRDLQRPRPAHLAVLRGRASCSANFPLSVIVDGVGLNITVVSYKNRVDFGIVGDREQIDDAWAFLEGAAHALQELENLKATSRAFSGSRLRRSAAWPARRTSPMRSKRSESPSRAAKASSCVQWRRSDHGSALRPSIVASTSHRRSPSPRPAYQPVGADSTWTSRPARRPTSAIRAASISGCPARASSAVSSHSAATLVRSASKPGSVSRMSARRAAATRRSPPARPKRGRASSSRRASTASSSTSRNSAARASIRSAIGGQPPLARRVKPSISDQRYQDLLGDPNAARGVASAAPWVSVSVAVVFAALGLFAAVARADTIVFRVETDILRMNGDGSGQRALTHGEQRFEWPSTADDGTLVATDELGRLHRLGRATAPRSARRSRPRRPSPPRTSRPRRRRTCGSRPTAPRSPTTQLIDGDPTTLWTPATRRGLELPGQAFGQQGFISPSWIGNDRLVLSRDVTSDAPAAGRALHGRRRRQQRGSRGSRTTPAAGRPGFGAVASRDGTRIAVLEDDAADHDGLPTRVALRLFTAAGPGAPPAFRCELALEAADTYALASPTFSPDGRRLAWAESDGIHAATLGALNDCGAIREQVLTLPGAWEPHWSAATEPRPRPPARRLRRS